MELSKLDKYSRNIQDRYFLIVKNQRKQDQKVLNLLSITNRGRVTWRNLNEKSLSFTDYYAEFLQKLLKYRI